MIVRFDFEGASPAIADIDDAGVLARALQHTARTRRQPPQVHARRFIGAVLAPHHAENAKLSPAGVTSAQQLDYMVVFLLGKPVLLDDGGGDWLLGGGGPASPTSLLLAGWGG